MSSKRCADGSEYSEHKKQMKEIHFEWEICNVAWVLNYFKQTYPSKLDEIKSEKNLG